MIDVIAVKDIGGESHERRLLDTNPSNKKDGGWRSRLVLRCLDDYPLDKLFIAGQYDENYCNEDGVEACFLIFQIFNFNKSWLYC